MDQINRRYFDSLKVDSLKVGDKVKWIFHPGDIPFGGPEVGTVVKVFPDGACLVEWGDEGPVHYGAGEISKNLSKI